MERYAYKLAGIYANRMAAEQALQHVVASGIDQAQVRCAWPADQYVDRKVEPETVASRNHMLRNAIAGTIVGAVVGLTRHCDHCSFRTCIVCQRTGLGADHRHRLRRGDRFDGRRLHRCAHARRPVGLGDCR